MISEKLSFIFQVMVYVGLGLPLVNLVIGVISSTVSGGGTEAGMEADTDLGPGGEVDIGGELDLDVGGEIDIGLGGELDIDISGEIELDFDTDLPDFADVDIDFDADTDFDTGSGGGADSVRIPLKFNLYCLCVALVTMGATGIYFVSRFDFPFLALFLALGAALAFGLYFVMYRFVVYPLKKNKASALNQRELKFRHAIVTFRITRDSPGKIQTRDAVGAFITYRAEIDRDVFGGERIDEGVEVVITEIIGDLCNVAPARNKILS